MSLGTEVFLWGLIGVLVDSRMGHGNGYFHLRENGIPGI